MAKAKNVDYKYNDMIDYLKMYHIKERRLLEIEAKIQHISSPVISNEAKSTAPGKNINDYILEKDNLIEEMSNIVNAIDNISDFRTKLILKSRYIDYMKLEDVYYTYDIPLNVCKTLTKQGINNLVESKLLEKNIYGNRIAVTRNAEQNDFDRF